MILMNHKCFKCGQPFKQKGHLDNHLLKKFDCRPCNENYRTDYVYIDQTPIHINIYIANKDNIYKTAKLCCQKGHKLVLVNGKTRKKHFRHKRSCDVGGGPMTKWHAKWQGHFPVTEVLFKKCSDKQHRDRFADVHIEEHNTILEIQHSPIDIETVSCRNIDYKMNNQTVIWIIDGNTDDVSYEQLPSGDGHLITFYNEWKYKSFFSTYNFVLLDIDDKIFKIPVKKVCARMILVKDFKFKKTVIEKLMHDPRNIWNIWEDDNEVKASLTIVQKGAGNGKTYGIWKSITENYDKKTFIIITKQHTAKNVILKELQEQEKRGEIHIVGNIENINIDKYNKQYVITIKKYKCDTEITVIIGTIDSFIWAITTNKLSASDYFTSMLKTINETNRCDKVKPNGSINYAGTRRGITRETEIWIDEAQDLPIDYYTAIMKLMLQTKVDVVIVGDKLQSLEFEKNFITEPISDGENNHSDNIRFDIKSPSNINRRINIKGMGEKINKLVHFSTYNVLGISDTPLAKINDTNSSIETFKLENIYANEPDKNKIMAQINNIIDKVKNEVRIHNYKPEDFLFIFPIMKGNVLATELETRLNEYWNDEIYKEVEEYKSYAVLHKHQDGHVIDTDLSKNASRIMSIRSSKGDGRKVVFILNCTEQSLKLVSNGDINLLFESHFHVALTRAKNKVYFGLQYNNDVIHKRFGSNDYVLYQPVIKTKFRLSTLCKHINTPKMIDNILKKNNIMDYEEVCTSQTDVQTIDWGFHCIRHAVYYNYSIFSVLQYDEKNQNTNAQIITILKAISKLPIRRRSPREFYNYLNKVDPPAKPFEFFPLCDQSHKSIYKNYCGKIEKYMETIKHRIKNDPLLISELTPIEAVILTYMINIFTRHKYHDITPRELYDIIDCFEKNTDKIKELMVEAEQIKKIIKSAMDHITNDNKSIIWNIEHILCYGGTTEDFGINNTVPIIGYDPSTVYHIMLRTDYSQLNHWDTMIDIMMERFLISDPRPNDRDTNNVTRYKGKHIKTYLFILKQNNYKIFEWDWEHKMGDELKKLYIDAILHNLSEHHKPLFLYYKRIKEDKTKWKDEYTTPMKYMVNAYNKLPHHSPYVVDFFKYLETKHKEGGDAKKWVKRITDNEDEFISSITSHITDALYSFFGLRDENEVSDDEF